METLPRCDSSFSATLETIALRGCAGAIRAALQVAGDSLPADTAALLHGSAARLESAAAAAHLTAADQYSAAAVAAERAGDYRAAGHYWQDAAGHYGFARGPIGSPIAPNYRARRDYAEGAAVRCYRRAMDAAAMAPA